MITCMNCGSNTVHRQGNTLKCPACKYVWTVEDEQLNASYIRTVLRRKPLEPLSEEELTAAPAPTPVSTEVIVPEALETLTVEQLKALAESQGIDLRGARVKADILMVLAESGVQVPGGED